MDKVELHWRERRALTHLLKHTSDATTLRRVQALLWLDRGERVADVAERLGVSRQVIYQWIKLFQSDETANLALRLAAGARSGRPPTAQGIIDPWLDEVIDHDPRTYDYNATIWTAPLLAQYLAEQHDLSVSVPSVRLALRRLKITWKRPRYQLSLRSPTWRQAKGGLKKGSGHGHAPSF
jgi:transposase